MSTLSHLTKIICVTAAAGMTLATADAQRVVRQPPVLQPQPNAPVISRLPPDVSKFRLTCAGLAKLKWPDAAILSAAEDNAGFFQPPVPPSPSATPPVANLPGFCRVVGLATPSPTSKILFEVWLPLRNYNGDYEQVGNGGFAGVVNYGGLGEGIRRGYATASTDDGHQGFQDATFANVSHDKIVDFGWRALKETTDKAKDVIHAFYGSAPHYSYFFGCSDGGREAMQEAQKFPADFDGIIAGAPANHWTHQFTALAYNTQAAYDHTAPAFTALLPPSVLPALSSGVRKQCAGHDGGLPSDLFLTDPRLCVVDWSKIQCASGQVPPACLTAQQVVAVKAINAGAKNASGQIYPGYELGSEDQSFDWQVWITGPSNLPPFPTFGLQTFFGEGFFANFVYHVPVYNLMTLDMNSGLADADALAPDLNAEDPDLTPFRNHGGKLIQYAGWADAAVAPRDGIAYYEAVRTALGSPVYSEEQKFYRLFLAPGMDHCSGGPGADAFGNDPLFPAPAGQADADHDVLMALARWREMGTAPDKIIATHYVGDNPASGMVAFQRPLCPYPQLPRYDGSGNVALASSFVCEARSRREIGLPGFEK
jgi:tannase/feruloyl esterase